MQDGVWEGEDPCLARGTFILLLNGSTMSSLVVQGVGLDIQLDIVQIVDVSRVFAAGVVDNLNAFDVLALSDLIWLTSTSTLSGETVVATYQRALSLRRF